MKKYLTFYVLTIFIALTMINADHTITEDLSIEEEKTNVSQPEIDIKKSHEDKFAKFKNPEFMIEATSNNFQQYLLGNNYVLAVFYYLDKCNICQKLVETMENMQDFAKEENIAFIKLDAEKNFELFKTLGFKILPGLIFSVRGYKPVIYEGEHNAKEISLFIRKMIYPIVKELKTVEEVEKFKTLADVTFVEFSKNVSRAVEMAAKKNTRFLFATCSSLECLEKYNPDLYSLPIINDEMTKDNASTFKEYSMLKLFKSFDERENTLIKCTNPDTVDAFIDENAFPTIAEVTETTLERIFKSKKNALILFDNETKFLKYTLDKVASKLRKYELILVYSDPSQKYNSVLMAQAGITPLRVPALVIISSSGETSSLYRLKTKSEDFINTGEELILDIQNPNITANTILNFAHEWKYQLLGSEPKSQAIQPFKGNVFQLVSFNFVETILDPTKAVFVEFYSPECKHCQQFEPTYEELGRVLKQNSDLIIAKLDVTTNIVPVPVQKIPTLVLFTAGKKKSFTFDWDRNLEDMIIFLRAYSGLKITALEEDL